MFSARQWISAPLRVLKMKMKRIVGAESKLQEEFKDNLNASTLEKKITHTSDF